MSFGVIASGAFRSAVVAALAGTFFSVSGVFADDAGESHRSRYDPSLKELFSRGSLSAIESFRIATIGVGVPVIERALARKRANAIARRLDARPRARLNDEIDRIEGDALKLVEEVVRFPLHLAKFAEAEQGLKARIKAMESLLRRTDATYPYTLDDLPQVERVRAGKIMEVRRSGPDYKLFHVFAIRDDVEAQLAADRQMLAALEKERFALHVDQARRLFELTEIVSAFGGGRVGLENRIKIPRGDTAESASAIDAWSQQIQTLIHEQVPLRDIIAYHALELTNDSSQSFRPREEAIRVVQMGIRLGETLNLKRATVRCGRMLHSLSSRVEIANAWVSLPFRVTAIAALSTVSADVIRWWALDAYRTVTEDSEERKRRQEFESFFKMALEISGSARSYDEFFELFSKKLGTDFKDENIEMAMDYMSGAEKNAPAQGSEAEDVVDRLVSLVNGKEGPDGVRSPSAGGKMD